MNKNFENLEKTLAEDYDQIVELFISSEQKSNKNIAYKEIKKINAYLNQLDKEYLEVSKIMKELSYTQRAAQFYQLLKQRKITIKEISQFFATEIVVLAKHYDSALKRTIEESIDEEFEQTKNMYHEVLGTEILFFSVYKMEKRLKALISLYSEYRQSQELHYIELSFLSFLTIYEESDDDSEENEYTQLLILHSISTSLIKYLRKLRRRSKNIISINLPFVSDILVRYFCIFSEFRRI